MKPPLLINSVLPTKIFRIYTAEWRAVTDMPADTAHEALARAIKEYGPVCRSAVIKKPTNTYENNSTYQRNGSHRVR